MNLPLVTPELAQTFILVFLRTGAMMAMMPVIGDNATPLRIKAGLSLIIAFMIAPVVSVAHIPDPALLDLALKMAGEVLIGVMIGFAARLIFAGIQIAGQFVGFQMGFAIVNVIDPISSAQVSIIAQIQYLLAILIFLIINGHHFFIMAIAEGYRVLPAFGFQFSGALMDAVFQLSRDMFVIALKLSAPIIAVLFFTNVGLGIIARTVPQMNIFIVGFPLQIGIGLIAFGLMIPFMVKMFEKLILGLNSQVSWLIKLM